VWLEKCVVAESRHVQAGIVNGVEYCRVLKCMRVCGGSRRIDFVGGLVCVRGGKNVCEEVGGRECVC
jgi:hypothetical protein